MKCVNCGSSDTVIWGKTARGIVRYKCKICLKTFAKTKLKKEKKSKYFNRFLKWVSSGSTVKDLALSETSPRTLARYFLYFLDYSPQPAKLSGPKEINLKCDAKYFGRDSCVLVFKEGKNIIFWHHCEKESFQNYVWCFRELLELGYIIKSVTSDKHGSIVAAVKWLFPGIPHQYCLVHIQRRCQTLLTQRPDTNEGWALLRLVKVINTVRSKGDEAVFRKWLENYENDNKVFLSQKTYGKKLNGSKTWWYTHRNVRFAFRHIKTSLDHMFLYLEDSNIPKDTNGLEAEFTHLKTKLNMHRGLARKRLTNFVSWYWYIKYKKNN